MVHVHATSMYAVPVSMLHLYILVSKAVGGVIVKVISAFFFILLSSSDYCTLSGSVVSFF